MLHAARTLSASYLHSACSTSAPAISAWRCFSKSSSRGLPVYLE